MVPMISIIQKFLFKQGRIFVRYNKSHPRFKWYLGIDALVSVLAVTGALVFVTSSSNPTRGVLIQSSGAQALSSNQLISLVKDQKFVAYWLGPISGSKYTLVASNGGGVTISYLDAGLGISNPNQHNLVIQTVSGRNDLNALISPIGQIDTARDSTVTGNTFSYNKYKLDHMNVLVRDAKRAVLVFYPSTRSAFTMQIDAEALQRIS